MKNIIAFTSILALSIAAPISAQPGGEKGKGNGNAKNMQSKPDRGNDGNKGDQMRGNKPAKAEKRGGGNDKAKADRQDNRGAKQNNNQNERVGNHNQKSNVSGKSDREQRDKFGNDKGDFRDRNVRTTDRDRRGSERIDVTRVIERVVLRNEDERRRFSSFYDRDFRPISGFCPPGLAKKGNGCQPPGQAKKNSFDDRNYFQSSYSRYGDGDWRYYDGYAYRANTGNSLIDAFLPVVGGALFGGNKWPAAYNNYDVPQYYGNYYGSNDRYNYRYADRTIFSVDPEDQAIMGIAALLTGDDIQIGQPMPRGYDAYNVPYAYRDQYFDRPDASYRYSDGYVYQVDPKTQLVAAAIELVI